MATGTQGLLIYLRRLQPAVSKNPPGDPRLWQALRSTVGDVTCSRGTLLSLRWPEGARRPDPGFLESSLGLPGLYDFSIRQAFISLSVAVRSRGGIAHPLETLLPEWLALKGYDAPSEIWAGRLYELSAGGGEADEKLAEACVRLLALGERSGIYAPDGEEARVFREAETAAWPWIEGKADAPVSQALLEACAGGERSLIRHDTIVKELRPRTPVAVTELRPALQDLLWSWNLPEDPASMGCLASPPLHFVVSAPARPDCAEWAFDARSECEKIAGFYDRPIGTLDLRHARTTVASVEVSSPLPLAHKTLSPSQGLKKSVLYAVGPWDSRNPVMERRIESLIARRFRNFPVEGEVVEGRQDWGMRVGQLVSVFEGWTFRVEGLGALLKGNHARNRFHRTGFFWGEEGLEVFGQEAGVPLHAIGTRNGDGRVFVGNEAIHSHGLVWPSESYEEGSWSYPELKSPTYGYEKATLFPDRYLAKVVVKEANLSDWHSQLWIASGGDRLRSALYRNEYSTSLDGLRWTDGETLWAEACGFKEGWAEIDPRQSAVACVDAAMRSLIALGVKPGDGGVANVWLTHPEEAEANEDARAKLGAYLLSAQGLGQALQAFRFSVINFNAFAPAYSAPLPEIRVFLRSRLAPDAPQTVPGFRMSGEVLYAIGPRPAFMDAGSHLLSHVKVISNHLSRLTTSAQAELYALVWELMKKGVITSIRPIGEGGIAGAAAEMALWGGMGAQLRPNLPTIELFSGAPGRFLVGVLPSEAKTFEGLVKSELLTPVGMTGTEKVLGLPLEQLKEARRGKVNV